MSYLIGIIIFALSGSIAAASSREAEQKASSSPNAASPALPEHRESVVVTGHFDPLPLNEAERRVSTWDVQENLLLINSTADLLRLDSSVDLRQRAPNTVQSDVSIRGSTFAQTLVLIDGMRLNDPQTGHHNMDLPLPVEGLERVEVLRGAGSTLYGSEAIGGVVNFISQRPESSEFRLRGALGNFGVNQQSGAISLLGSGWTQQFTFSRDFSSGFLPGREYRNLSAGSNTHWKNRLGNARLLLGFTDRPFGAEQFYCNCDSWERTKGWFASARQDWGASTEMSFTWRRHSDLFVLYRSRPWVSTNRHISQTYQGTVRRRHEVRSNVRLYYGGEGLADEVISNNLGNHSRIRAAAYAALDVRALGRYSFTAGFREEVHGRFQGQWIPSAGFGVWISPALKLRGSVSKGFRLPTYTELYYRDPASQGNPALQPEAAWNYEAGADLLLGNLWRAELTLFHRRETNGIDWVRLPGATRWQATNYGTLRFTGLEVAAKTRIRRSQEAGLAWTTLSGSAVLQPGSQSRYVFNYPEHSLTATWSGRAPGGIVARSRLGVLQRYRQEAYCLWDLYLARSSGRLRPFLQLTNLTDARYQEISNVPMPGRGVLGGVELVLLAGR